MNVANADNSVRTYGNFRKPESPGLLGLPLGGTILLFVMLGLVAMLASLSLWIPAAALFVLLGLMVVGLAKKDRHHRSLMARLSSRVGWRATRASGAHIYRSGPLSRHGHGKFHLPGLLASTTLYETADSYDRPFAVLHMPSVNHYAVCMAVSPEGASLVNGEQVDRWVAGWGQWLANLGVELGVVAAQATIETAPDSGARLRREVTGRIDPQAPPLAKEMLANVMQDYPSGSSHDRAWVTVTFTGRAPGGRSRKVEEVLRDLAARLPGLTQGLSDSTGAGFAVPVTAQQLCEVVRVAYDPAAADLLDQAADAGDLAELDWADIGPAAAEASWDAYRHDGALSRTWVMSSAPMGEIYSSVLTRLLSPHPDIARKRITICYRPIDSARSSLLVETDKKSARVRVSSSNQPSARAVSNKETAEATAKEEARGAGLIDFAVLMTATVTDPARMADARVAIEGLAATARLRIRPAWGSQDSAFAAALPLGLVLPAHSRVPQEIREQWT